MLPLECHYVAEIRYQEHVAGHARRFALNYFQSGRRGGCHPGARPS